MKTAINIKADKEVKENAQKIAKELGMPLSVVINAFLKDFIRNRGVAFSSIPRMTPVLENILGKVEKDISEKKNISKTFSSAEEANEYLDRL